MSISDSALVDNIGTDPGLGGAVYADGCELSFDSVSISGSTARFGGAIFSFAGQLDFVDSELYGNSADVSGGLWYGLAYNSESNVITFDETSVYGNSAGYVGGALMIDGGSEAYCYGSSTTSAGFWDNSADGLGYGFGGGAIRVYDSTATFEADTCDFGTDGDRADNTPDDIRTSFGDTAIYDSGEDVVYDTGDGFYNYDDDASVTCTTSGCE